MKTKTVVGLGEILWDMYPDGKYVGGAPANAAIHVQRLGGKGIIASAVGRDPLGREILDYLMTQGMERQYIQRISTMPTGTVKVVLDSSGKPSFSCSENTAFDEMHWNEALRDLAYWADAVIVGTLAQRKPISKKTIQQFLSHTRGLRVYDVNLRGWDLEIQKTVRETLKKVDVIKLNETELTMLQKAFGSTDDAVSFLNRLIAEFELSLASLSLGAEGCLLTDGSHTIHVPGIPGTVVDTTGCGDAFTAGMVIKLLEEAPLEEIAQFANALGAFVATKKGAAPFYSIQELEAFIQEHVGFQNKRENP